MKNEQFLKMQKLAGLITESEFKSKLNEGSSSEYTAILQDWIEDHTDMMLEYPEDYEESLEYIESFKKINVSSLEELAQTIKEIDDNISNDIGVHRGEFYNENVKGPLIEICDNRNFGEKDALISMLDKMYDEDGNE